jgi:hypothetical protein
MHQPHRRLIAATTLIPFAVERHHHRCSPSTSRRCQQRYLQSTVVASQMVGVERPLGAVPKVGVVLRVGVAPMVAAGLMVGVVPTAEAGLLVEVELTAAAEQQAMLAAPVAVAASTVPVVLQAGV